MNAIIWHRIGPLLPFWVCGLTPIWRRRFPGNLIEGTARYSDWFS
jgi:hypothetical protein